MLLNIDIDFNCLLFMAKLQVRVLNPHFWHIITLGEEGGHQDNVLQLITISKGRVGVVKNYIVTVG